MSEKLKIDNYEKAIKEILRQNKEIERLKELCDKYEEEHKTTFEEWKKTINIIKEVREHCNLHLKTANEVIVESEKWLEVEEQAEFAKRDIHTAKVVKRNMEDILEILDKENI